MVELTAETVDPAIWGKNFPLEYDLYKTTCEMAPTRRTARRCTELNWNEMARDLAEVKEAAAGLRVRAGKPEKATGKPKKK